jgi:uncharacterized repeat protein (TIGR03803 family)
MRFATAIIARGTAALVSLFVLMRAPALAQTETVVYSFGSQSGDGTNPVAGLIMDKKGNFYGTTNAGGSYGSGTVFEVTASGEESVLYSFCSEPNCTDGANPFARLVMDKKGNLYGTTIYGGAYDDGAVFEVTPEGVESVLYSFGSQTFDGIYPYAALIMDKEDNLYGTTYEGGANVSYDGTIFKLSPEPSSGCPTGGNSGNVWCETILYSFCPELGCTDGANPTAGLIMDKLGNLYGTTQAGGDMNCLFLAGCGTVFKLTPAGDETVLYSFGTRAGDGIIPTAVIMDKAGNFYGTTSHGGSGANSSGTVFEVTASGEETVLYNFCSEPNCADGANPFAGLVMDKKGNLYGTTDRGGDGVLINGTVFELTASGEESVLYSFCSEPNCADGANPFAGLVMDKKGNLYGTTVFGGAYGDGTVFELTRVASAVALRSRSSCAEVSLNVLHEELCGSPPHPARYERYSVIR